MSEEFSHLHFESLDEQFQKTPGECDCFPSPSYTQGLDGTLTGVVSFHSIFSRLLNQPVHTSLRTAHLLFVVSTATNLTDLMEDTLILAKSVSFAMKVLQTFFKCDLKWSFIKSFAPPAERL